MTTIPDDWYPGTLPPNIRLDPTAYLGTSHTFRRFRSRRDVGLTVGPHASLCDGLTLDVGPEGVVRVGAYAIVTSALLVADAEITIGDYAMLAWDVVVMDVARVLDRRGGAARPSPVRIGHGAWIGFGACVLPGVTVGDGAIVGARTVVARDVADGAVIVGNPARIVRGGDASAVARELATVRDRPMPSHLTCG